MHAAASEQDGAIFLTAAFTGLRRGELLALRWRDIDFEGEAIRVEGSVDRGVSGTTKSDKGRNVPMVEPVAQALARLRPASALHSSRGSRLSKRSGRAPSTLRLYAGASSGLVRERSYGRSDSTTCDTRSARSRSIAARSCRCRRGWVTRTSTRRGATCITRARAEATTRSCSPPRLRSRRRSAPARRQADEPDGTGIEGRCRVEQET